MEVTHFFCLTDRTALDLSRLAEDLNEFVAASDAASSRLEEWRRASHRASDSNHLRRTSAPGCTLFERRARGQHASAHRARTRGIHQAGGAEYAGLGMPLTFLRGGRASDAPGFSGS